MRRFHLIQAAREAALGACRQYLLVLAAIGAVTALNLLLAPLMGHRAVAYPFLFVVLGLSLYLDPGPITLAAALSAFLWNVLFIPPRFTFYVEHPEDALMLGLYFVIALTIGNLASRLRRQEQAARRHQMLLESERLYRTLLNAISHEFRTPITAIGSAISNLLNDKIAATPEARVALIAEIKEANDRLNRLVKNLLDMAHLEAGRLVPNLQPCAAGELIDAALGRVAKALAGRPVTVDAPPHLPPVRVDFALIEQVLRNLLHNASVHTPSGTPVRVAATVEGGYLAITVADRGPGMPPEVVAHAFEKFYRAPAAPPGGTGLGLSICKGFVEAHHGTIQAQNLPEGGACFQIRLPLDSPLAGMS